MKTETRKLLRKLHVDKRLNVIYADLRDGFMLTVYLTVITVVEVLPRGPSKPFVASADPILYGYLHLSVVPESLYVA